MYADDLVLVSVDNTWECAESLLESDYLIVQKWMHDNVLIINHKKTKIMPFRKPQDSRHDIIAIKSHSFDCLHNNLIGYHCCHSIETVDSFC